MLVMKRCERSEMKLMKERHVSWSWRRTRATVGWQQKIVNKKSGACKQEKKEEATVPSQSNGCCFDSVMEQLFTLGGGMRDSRSKPCKKNSSEGSKFQPLLCTWQEEKREEESGKRSKREERPVAN